MYYYGARGTDKRIKDLLSQEGHRDGVVCGKGKLLLMRLLDSTLKAAAAYLCDHQSPKDKKLIPTSPKKKIRCMCDLDVERGLLGKDKSNMGSCGI